MKPANHIISRSILVGLAGILVIVALYFLAAYLSDQEWQEHYRTSPGSGVFLVGVYPWILFFFEVLAAFAAMGAFSAWASRRHITSNRDAVRASAVAALVPILPAAILALILAVIAVNNSPEHYGAGFFTYLLPVLAYFFVYALLALAFAITGGVAYRLLSKWLTHLKKGSLR